jgi:ABC-type uncharacterized transport system auxiliary subunit
MKIKNLIVTLLIILMMFGCAKLSLSRNYFILDYNPIIENPKLSIAKPFPYSVQVMDSRMPRTYDRSQIVIRYSAHKLSYSTQNIWAVRLSYLIPDLINKQIKSYNIFSQTQREYLEERPDYEIITYVNRVELFKNEYYTAAHLSMDYYLRKSNNHDDIIKYSFDIEQQIAQNGMDIFAQKISNLLKDHTDIFLIKVIDYFDSLDKNNSVKGKMK